MLTKKDPKQESKAKNNKNGSEETQLAKTQPSFLQTTSHLKPSHHNDLASHDKRGYKTRVTIKYDVGFSNQLYIRGKGANLSWDKGIPLKNTKADEWIWESEANFSNCEFKVLVNDKHYEKGENHLLTAGATIIYTPHF